MANVQKEIGHLEHWLSHLPAEPTATTTAVAVPATASMNPDLVSLTSVVNRLSEQLTTQQHTLHHLMDRITILENLRQVHIDELSQKSEDPWLDNQCIPLTNEVIGDDCLSEEPLYTFHKETSQAATQPIVLDTPDAESDSQEEHDVEPVVLCAPPTTPVTPAPVPQDKKMEEKEKEIVQEGVEKEEKVEEEEEEAEEVEEDEVEEEEDVEEEVVEEVEEEEEGVELEEMEYKGTKYYRDGEGFIYTIDEDEQPSENPVGYWKEKTQTIAFYKTK